ncbi:MAG: hypothetical protein ACRDX9_06470 [Acidimicrobiia bacterium]
MIKIFLAITWFAVAAVVALPASPAAAIPHGPYDFDITSGDAKVYNSSGVLQVTVPISSTSGTSCTDNHSLTFEDPPSRP